MARGKATIIQRAMGLPWASRPPSGQLPISSATTWTPQNTSMSSWASYFLKYISDAFEERHAQLLKEVDQGADPEDRDEYRADNIFWVPKEARWSFLQANAKQATIGKFVDDAMVAIERDNRSLKGVLPKDYARPALDKQRLGELIDLIANIGLGDAEEPLQGHPGKGL